MSKPLRYTQHSLDVMRERAIELTWVERTVARPEWSEPDPLDDAVERRFAKVPERGGRYLRVACVETFTEIRILSTFLDRGAKPK
ncbi:MAG TPA: DUF4258 domain-containing protein [Devosia sp.]|nr:DUF4258 domain-containing protein [Devosia sp.]